MIKYLNQFCFSYNGVLYTTENNVTNNTQFEEATDSIMARNLISMSLAFYVGIIQVIRIIIDLRILDKFNIK